MTKTTQPPYTLSISKDELAKLPVTEYEGNIKLIERPEEVERAVSALRSSDIIGFDTETRPSFKKGQSNLVSLLQLSTRSTCYLFRLNRIGLPPEVRAILEDPDLTKIGLSIHDDFHNLSKICEDLRPAGFIELQQYAKQFNLADISLTKLCGLVFGRRISKGQRLSNWEADDLSEGQLMYASLDAMACIDLYEYLRDGKFNPADCPYKVYHTPAENDSDEK
ncbi:MAG: 3'-5' exonuclease domain-containing protein 2 [Muribaculaceae bacterium]|nr:3'-5' exonuclease domain-containing protein 2 [Muribaculaceae bacterium]